MTLAAAFRKVATVLRVFLQRLTHWLFISPRAIWAGVALPIALILGCWMLPWDAALRIRIAGYSSTFAGVILVVFSISQRLQTFTQAGLLAHVNKWVKQFATLFRPPQVIEATAQFSMGGVFAVGELEVIRAPAEGEPVEQRLDEIEREISRLRQRADDADRREKENFTLIEKTIADETSNRDRAFRDLERKLKDVSVGSITWEVAGLFWVLSGSFMTTFSNGTACKLAKFFELF